MSAASFESQYESIEKLTSPEYSAARLLEFAPHPELDIDGHRDVYNITAPFEFDGLNLIAGRNETRHKPLKSRIGFYAEDNGIWHKVSHFEYPDLELEDPFVTRIDNRLILGAVQVNWQTEPLDFMTVFFEVESLERLHPVAQGPARMKDIRLKQLEDGQLLVMTRPEHHGPHGVDRQIGWFTLNGLAELTPERIQQEAIILNGLFAPGEWGGSNEIHLIDDEWAGVLAHKAHKDEAGNLHYSATVFELNYRTGEFTPMREILAREDFPDAPSKTDQLRNVVFSGGIHRPGNGYATWYGGVGDVAAGQKTIEDPFHQTQEDFFPTAA